MILNNSKRAISTAAVTFCLVAVQGCSGQGGGGSLNVTIDPALRSYIELTDCKLDSSVGYVCILSNRNTADIKPYSLDAVIMGDDGVRRAHQEFPSMMVRSNEKVRAFIGPSRPDINSIKGLRFEVRSNQ